MDPKLVAQIAAILAFMPTLAAYTSACLAGYALYLAISGVWQGIALYRLVFLVGASFCLFWVASDQLGWEKSGHAKPTPHSIQIRLR